MARPSNLEGRLRAILDGTRNRAALTRMMVIGVVTLLVAIVTPVAMMKASSAEASKSKIETENKGPSVVTARAEWGEPIEGVQVRLHAQPSWWGWSEPPQLLVDIANRGAVRFDCPTNFADWDLEMDGREYFVLPGGSLGFTDGQGVDPGQVLTNLIVSFHHPWLPFDSRYTWESLRFSPGKHTVRVRIRNSSPSGRLWSNPVEIEIASPTSVSQTEVGEPVQGVQLRLHARRTQWATNEPLQLLVDIVNRGTSRFVCPSDYQPWDLEVDGGAYPTVSDTAFGANAGPNPNQTVPDVPFTLDSKRNPHLLHLAPGKHVLRVRMYGWPAVEGSLIAAVPAMQVISNPLEIEVAAPGERHSDPRPPEPAESQRSEVGSQRSEVRDLISAGKWGEPVEGVRVRLHAQQTKWATNESARLLVDIVNLGPAHFDCPTDYRNWDVEVDGHQYRLQLWRPDHEPVSGAESGPGSDQSTGDLGSNIGLV